jgi:outer membrane protein assembly factor BamB
MVFDNSAFARTIGASMSRDPDLRDLSTRGAEPPATRKPPRLWPGILLVAVQWLGWYAVPALLPDARVAGVLVGLLCSVLLVVWWLFFSRASWPERLGALALIALVVAAVRPLLHESIRGGMMGMMFVVSALPPQGLALVLWAALSRRLSGVPKAAVLAGLLLLACGPFLLLRTDGISGDSASALHWRWTPTSEEQLLAKTPAAIETAAAIDARSLALTNTAPEWPGFRGPNRDSIVRGIRLDTNWTQRAPSEVWRKPVGPAWSSFAVHSDRFYTQEQRGEDEVVSCYRLADGEPVWMHRDLIRFYESNAGPGPRATPTLHNGRVYTLGAKGTVNALDAATGKAIWSRDAAAETGQKVPEWGFAGSPVVVEDRVIVALAGQLLAYDLATGAPRWQGPPGGGGYSSPHLAKLGGVPQILLLRGARTISLAPADGSLLWDYKWQPAVSIVQPAFTPEGDVLVAAGDAMGGIGMRRLAITRGPSGWTAGERWTSRGLKPYFNDFVVHEGHAYGFDGSILACIDLADGQRVWKGGRYGHGQLLLLADQDLLLVLSERGEVALAPATPEDFVELAKFPAIKGKTWNHPVVVGDLLLVRNAEEMAAFRLAKAAN